MRRLLRQDVSVKRFNCGTQKKPIFYLTGWPLNHAAAQFHAFRLRVTVAGAVPVRSQAEDKRFDSVR
jgi:hypothetical protein